MGDTPAPVVVAMMKLSPHAALKPLWMAAVSSVTPSPLAPKTLMEVLPASPESCPKANAAAMSRGVITRFFNAFSLFSDFRARFSSALQNRIEVSTEINFAPVV
jgi:hypothetical protein